MRVAVSIQIFVLTKIYRCSLKIDIGERYSSMSEMKIAMTNLKCANVNKILNSYRQKCRLKHIIVCIVVACIAQPKSYSIFRNVYV